ncbi:MAG TPA: amino acid adenylation domain-containing protein [Pyrinomonadaceae bacterium]|jgi:amino acid adenylation domain-containing protein
MNESPVSGRAQQAQEAQADGLQRLSYEQKLYWFLHQLAPESPLTQLCKFARTDAEVDAAALRRAFQRLFERHPLLGAVCAHAGGQPVLRFSGNIREGFEFADVSSLDQASFDALLAKESEKTFAIESEAMLRLQVFRRAAREHVLLLAAHRIVADSPTLDILMRELAALYGLEKSGQGASGKPEEQPALAAPENEYASYTLRQEQLLSSAEGERLERYWLRQLEPQPPPLSLPTDRQRPPVFGFRSASASLGLSRELTARLRALSEEHRTTLYTTLLASFCTLLHRYSGQPEFPVGAFVSARRDALSGAVGNFDDYLVIKADLSGAPSFMTLLERMQRTVAEASAHGRYPFLRLVENLQPPRDASRWPLFQVAFDLRETSAHVDEGEKQSASDGENASSEADGLRLRSWQAGAETSHFDLALMMTEQDGALQASLKYSTALFDAETIGRMLGHFETLLGGIITGPQRPVSTLPLLTEKEREQILLEWNNTNTDDGARRCLHHFFEQQVERAPGAIVVRFEQEQLTYLELNRRANRLARHLQTCGVGPEVRVGIFIEPSLEMAVGCLAILKAGGAVVFLDKSYPQERIAFLLEDAAIPVLITTERLVERLPAQGARVLCLDSDAKTFARYPETNPAAAIDAENLAWLAYTSGTTGKPKGILIPHRVLANFGTTALRAYDLTEDLRIFDMHGIFSIIMAMMCGGTVILARHETFMSPARMIAMLREHRINQATLPPALLGVLPSDELPSLRTVTTGGEKISSNVVGRWSQGRRFFLNYRCTEALSGTRHQCDEDFAARPTIGRPMANTQIYVLDQELQLLPAGIPGEMYIGGAGLARGYHNAPAATAERFLPDPFSREGGARLYRTGDVGRYFADGRLEFLGRRDNQVNIRGYRVELGEVEAALRQNAAVQDLAVMMREDIAGEKRIVAYLVAQDGASLTPGGLREFLKEKLPEYMIPSAFVVLDKLPLTPHRKVDYRALPAPEQLLRVSSESFVAPRMPMEEALCRIWSEVLKVERIGINDNFFELGGHSVTAVQVMARVLESFQVEIPLRRFFELPTVAELAVAIVEAEVARAGGEETARLLAELEQLSEDEAWAMLGNDE